MLLSICAKQKKKIKEEDVGCWSCPWCLVLSSFLIHGGETHLEEPTSPSRNLSSWFFDSSGGVGLLVFCLKHQLEQQLLLLLLSSLELL